jgi:ectoine hydroxylase-related dioxygenase (phytanoyl-CoA dioxygenase family)
MPVFSPEDHEFFKENGYVVFHDAVPQENLDAVIQALFEHLEMDPNDPEDWYRLPLKPGGMIEIYQHQALWDNRQFPRVHQAFSEIMGTEKLWVSIDRANFKPPSHPDHPEYDHKGFTHWDADTSRQPLVKRRRVQGVLYLADTAENQGGFQCVPDLYRCLEEWIPTQPADRNPRVPDLTGFEVKPIPGKAGDFLIWDVLLPHGNGHNTADRPRFSQFINMFPAPESDPERAEDRISQWREHRPPGNNVFPGDPRRVEEEKGHTAELTPLGRKLLGLDAWE